jgi:hypothetical protein
MQSLVAGSSLDRFQFVGTITGGTGRSLLIGGGGSANITGGSGANAAGGDILIGGKTSYDRDTQRQSHRPHGDLRGVAIQR